MSQLRLHLESFSQAELGRSLKDSWLGRKYSACLKPVRPELYTRQVAVLAQLSRSLLASLFCCIYSTQCCDLLTLLCLHYLNKVLIPIATPLLKYYTILTEFYWKRQKLGIWMVGTNNFYQNEMPTKIQSAGKRSGWLSAVRSRVQLDPALSLTVRNSKEHTVPIL